MDIDTDKIDEAVLALLYLSLHDQFRAWKGHDWGALDRVSTAETNCASWRRESVPVGLGEKGREALVDCRTTRCEPGCAWRSAAHSAWCRIMCR
jgi:hypothetical protein